MKPWYASKTMWLHLATLILMVAGYAVNNHLVTDPQVLRSVIAVQAVVGMVLIARYRNPRLIVESGVWKGQTSWLFRQACPKAEIHSFDIDLKTLEVKSDRVDYHETVGCPSIFPASMLRTALLFSTATSIKPCA